MDTRKYKCWFVAALLLAICVPSLTAHAASNPSILIFPFEIQMQGDSGYLQKGVFDMLQSRVAAGGGVDVIAYERFKSRIDGLHDSLSEEQALNIGSALGATYVVIGQIVIQGNLATTDARLIGLSRDGVKLSFHKQGANAEDVLAHIKALAGEIRSFLLGGAPQSAVSAAKPDSIPKPAEKSPKADDPMYMHPEKLWKGPSQLSNEPIRSMSGDGKLPVSIWKSPKFDMEIRSIAAGDVDGDGREEIVVAGDKGLFVYRYAEGKLTLLTQKTYDADTYLFRVDVADLNGNGRAEIYLSRMLRERTRVKSQVLEWDGKQLVPLAEPEMFLRVLSGANKKPILLGQESGMGSLFASKIQRLEWRGGALAPAGNFAVPFSESVYAFNDADALNAGQDVFVWITPEGFIRILQPDGEDWKGGERFTGAASYIPYPTGDEDRSGSGDPPRKRRYYIPQRILVTDIDRDGKNEILVISNSDMTTHYFPNIRIFRNGRIACLFWDGMGLARKWQTSEVSGHISDLMLMDLNGDKKPDMVFSVVARMNSPFWNAESYLVYWSAD
ncbi:FG-GAP-like repeat-containing protein [Desulfatirhabdium butyrativorans]|uniref:FG-GAP-like repeat-containing protein n=1 Tax=Desulfatirhabdium butyrativorans TaxID=340467 RepID=UPI0004159542|nr:FG-GAP-like repeat-containing protein [Desulfatirhabdium butyrativorans]